MEFNEIYITGDDYINLFAKHHGVNPRYANEIFGKNTLESMIDELDKFCGFRYERSSEIDEHGYIFEVINKNKYLMAKILYGI